MEVTRIDDGDFDSDHFFDALDCFPSLDLIDAEESVHVSQISQVDSFESTGNDANGAKPAPDSSLSSTLRHGSSTRFSAPKFHTSSANNLGLDSSAVSEISEISSAVELRNKTASISKEEKESGISAEKDRNRERIEEFEVAGSHFDPFEGHLSNSLISLAGLVIRAIGFQISLLMSSIMFPFWLLHSVYMLVISPLQTVKRARDRLHEKFSGICSVLLAMVGPSIQQQLHGSQSVVKFAARISWGFLWSVYVCFVLSGVLVSAFIMAGIAMRHLVEEPIRVEEMLNFDYTKPKPVAYVPIVSCHGVDCGLVWCGEKVEVGKRIIPPARQLEVTVSLVLPESDHNRKLGVFQVRVEFLSTSGKVSSASSHPCMLRFKSLLIHYFETFLKSAPLLFGYSSESQLLSITMTGFKEGTEPTACLRVILEQRAEFKPGAGIPEIYSASLTLESELPLLKRIIWKWRKTIYIWTTMWFLMMELFFIMVCCRSVVVPKPNLRNESGSRT